MNDELFAGEENAESVEEAKKKDFKVEIILVFILGVLLGMVFKTEAMKKITIGFEDYKVAPIRNDFDFAAMEADLLEKSAESAEDAEN